MMYLNKKIIIIITLFFLGYFSTISLQSKEIVITINGISYSFKEKLNKEFYDEFNSWSFESSSTPSLFGFSRSNLDGFILTDKKRIQQFSFRYSHKNENVHKIEVSVKNIMGNKLFYIDLTQNEDVELIQFRNLLINKSKVDSIINLDILDLSKNNNSAHFIKEPLGLYTLYD